MEKEIRTIKNKIQRDVKQDSRIVQGYAVIFDSQSENMGFYGTIHSGAITQEQSIILIYLQNSITKIIWYSQGRKMA